RDQEQLEHGPSVSGSAQASARVEEQGARGEADCEQQNGLVEHAGYAPSDARRPPCSLRYGHRCGVDCFCAAGGVVILGLRRSAALLVGGASSIRFSPGGSAW